MQSLSDLLKNFFTHKDFLPPAHEIAGTLFTPLHIIFAIIVLAAVILSAILLSKKNERTIRTVFAVIWIVLCILEVTKIAWETLSGKSVSFEWGGILPLYPCSIFLYALPFAIWGKGKVRYAACGYVCSLGFIGGAVNFVYPANILSNYSCISFSGFHTFLFHGAIVFATLVMLISGYHKYNQIHHFCELLLPSAPFLIVSVIANLVNFSKIDSDYMFFKLESFIFAPIGAATADWLSVIIVYVTYLILHALPYIPFYIKSKIKHTQQSKYLSN